MTFVFIQFVDEFSTNKKIAPDETQRSKHQMGHSVLGTRWDAAFCGVPSGLILFAYCPINKTPDLHVYGLKSRPKLTIMSP